MAVSVTRRSVSAVQIIVAAKRTDPSTSISSTTAFVSLLLRRLPLNWNCVLKSLFSMAANLKYWVRKSLQDDQRALYFEIMTSSNSPSLCCDLYGDRPVGCRWSAFDGLLLKRAVNKGGITRAAGAALSQVPHQLRDSPHLPRCKDPQWQWPVAVPFRSAHLQPPGGTYGQRTPRAHRG